MHSIFSYFHDYNFPLHQGYLKAYNYTLIYCPENFSKISLLIHPLYHHLPHLFYEQPKLYNREKMNQIYDKTSISIYK